jgi:chromosomal replication initiation ATPase DnaA
MEYPIEMYDYITNSHKAGRASRIVEVRRACMWALRKYSQLSLAKIGRLFDLDHSTVIHHINKMDGWIEAKDPQVVRLIKDIEWEMDEQLNK